MEVPAGKYVVSERKMIARTSQCVALGIIDNTYRMGGIAHIHYTNNHELLVLRMIEEILSKGCSEDNFSLYLCGGVDAFIPFMGHVPGKKNYERVRELLEKERLDKRIALEDCVSDFVRIMVIHGKNNFGDIQRILDE